MSWGTIKVKSVVVILAESHQIGGRMSAGSRKRMIDDRYPGGEPGILTRLIECLGMVAKKNKPGLSLEEIPRSD